MCGIAGIYKRTGIIPDAELLMKRGEDDKAVFVNMAGNIDPSQLGRLADKFDVPEIGSIDIQKGRD